MAEIVFAQVNESGQLVILLSDDRVVNVGNVVGPPGATGTRGMPGVPGPAGRDGNTIHSFTGVPDPAVGQPGDYAIDSFNWRIYGPRAGASWGAGQDLLARTGNPTVGFGGGSSPSGPAVTPNLTALNDVDHTASPALGTMPIWTYPAGHTSSEGKFYFNSPNAHLKNWDSTIHWESGATVFHNGELWRATQENSNVEPVIEAGKAMLFIHIAGEPSFALVPTGISSTPPPAGTQPMGAMRYAYWLVYKSDQDMDVWKFKITGKNPTTGKLEGVWEEKTWPCIAWRHPIPPPTKIDALSVWVWIYDQPGGTVQPVIGQQKWAQIHLSINVGQANDVEAMQPKGGDILVFDANKKKWVATSKADFLAMP